MKVICLALLLVLSLQLQLSTHDADTSLEGKTFIITKNSAKIKALNGIEVSFSKDRVTFKGCNTNSAAYKVSIAGGAIIIGPNFRSTLVSCPEDNDKALQELLIDSKSYYLSFGELTLYAPGRKVTLVLKQK